MQTVDDVLDLLDTLFGEAADRWTDRGGADWWDAFYADRDRPIPFFRWAPDESLVAWQDAGLLGVGPGTRVLELGSGPGRNAVWFAQQGGVVDALDLSTAAVAWGRERSASAGVGGRVTFHRSDIFRWTPPDEPYDVVYDSGCLHHLPPHRRVSYRALLERTLRPGGRFGLACFAVGGHDGVTGSAVADTDVYRKRGLGGGLSYGADDLRRTFGWLTELELRRMRAAGPDQPVFGEEFLWAALFRR